MIRRWLFAAALVVLACIAVPRPAAAQNANTLTIRFAGVPTGTCFLFEYGVNNATGDFYDCFAGSWNKVTGGGGAGSCTPPGTTASALLYDSSGGNCADVTKWTTNGTTTITGAATAIFDASAIATMNLPTSAGAAPTADGVIAFDSTAHFPVFGNNGATSTIPRTKASVSHNFLTGYTQSTGVITAGQPACGDLSDSGAACSSGASTMVNGQTCTLGSSCTIPFQTNGGGNTSQAGINLLTSTANSVGLTVTPTNSATNTEKFEITGSYTGNAATATSAAKWTTARNLAGNSVDGSGNVAFANAFIVQGTTDAGLSGAQFLGALGTGILKNTTTTGVLSAAAASDVVGLFSGCSGTLYLGADGACHAASGSGTVTVVGAGSLTSTALVTGGGTTTVQTPSGTATLDSSGDMLLPGTLGVTGHVTLEGVTSTGAQGTGALVFANTPTLTTPVIGAATGTSLFATGNVDGTSPLTITTGTTFTFGTTGTVAKHEYYFNEEVTAGTGVNGTLPTAAAGLQYCVANAYNGSAANTGVLTITTSTSGQFIIFTDGTLSASGGNVTSGGAAADSACVVGLDSTHWFLYVQSGIWTKH